MKNRNNNLRSRATAFLSLRIVLILGVLMVFAGFGAASAWNGGFGWLNIRTASAESKVANSKNASPFTPVAPLLVPDTRTVCDSGTPDFPTVAAAVTDANTAVPAGGRTYLVCAGLVETAPAGGYSITATGASAANPVSFVKSGGGANPTITAPTPQASGVLTDAIFKIIGADNITIDGFTMLENAANTTTAAGTNNMTEFGVVLFYASTTNGAQNITIQNNTITLNRTYQNTWGIYSNSTHSATVVTTSATATTSAGGNSGLKIYGNTISNVNQGISVTGPTAAADLNAGLDIGGTGGAQANSITNWGTTGTFSGYANVSGTLNCILVRNVINFNVSFNTLTSSVGGNTGTTNQRGIYVPSFSNAPTATVTNTINSNNISVQAGFVTAILSGIIVETTTGNATSSITISSNNFNTFGHTVASPTGAVNFINDTMANLNTTINSNTFTAISLTTTGSVLFIGHSLTNPAGGIDNISSNMIVTSFTKTGTGGGTLTFINNSAGSSTTVTQTWNNNNFSNITIPGTTAIAGMVCTDGGTVNHKCNNNTISNIVGGTGSITGILSNFGGALGGNGNEVIGNTITNITSAGAITGIQVGTSATATTISSNTIGAFSSTGASPVIGITAATSSTISKNKIYDLGGSNAGTTVNGIAITAGTSHTIVNNIVGNLTASAATVTSPGSAIIGINLTSTATASTINVYYNTVYINTSSSGANFATTGIFHAASATATTATLNLRNNIIDNRSTPSGTGFTVVFRRSVGTAGTLANYASTSNNNDFFLGTAGANKFIYSDGTSTASTIGAYKAGVFTAGTISPRDSASFSDPTYVSTTGTDATFLHINMAVPTQVESGGSPIAGITDDFDGDVRNGSTPDVGADEGLFTLLDLAGPIITYTPAPGNTTSTANRTITITVADPSGVPTTGTGLPVIYYRKGVSGVYASTQCVFVSGITYTCLINYTLVTGGSVTTGDTVQYYVAAQDNPGNVSVNPATGAGGFTANPPAAATPPTSPGSYLIAAAVTGTKTVCAAGFPTCDYGSLTNVGGIFEAINNNVVTGDVNIVISSNLTGETGAVALNQTSEELVASIHSITIKPSAGGPWSVTGTGTGGQLIKLNGADGVTIDGSMSGGTDRSLTLNNPNAATGTGTLFIASLGAGAGATNNTIKNCIIQTGSAGTASIFTFDIFVGDTTGAAAGADNDNLIIQNNQLIKARTGIQAVGAVGGVVDNLQITGNLIGDPVAATTVGRNPMVVSTVNNASITGNTIQNVAIAADSGSAIGISLATSTLSTIKQNTITGVAGTASSIQPTGIAVSTATTNLSITENTIDGVTNTGSIGPQGINVGSGVTNSSVTRNKVTNIIYTGTGGYGGKGIEINTLTNPSNILVANNFVSNIKGDCFATGSFTLDTVMGMRVIGSGTGGVNIYHNTVYLGSGGFTSTQTSTASMAFYVASTVAGSLNVRNNIFVNNLDNTSEAADHNYAFYSDAAASAFTDINFNDYWVPASTAGGPQTLGFIGSNRILLTDIQTGTTKDASSQNMDPMVASPALVPDVADLHLTGASPVQGLAQPLVGIVNNDVDNDLRDTAPDIGADEIVSGRGGTIPPGTYRDGVVGGAGLAGDTTFTGTLTLNGILTTGPFNLIIDCGASLAGGSASNFVVGNIRKNYCAGAAFVFPVGAVGGYSPLDVDVTAGTFPSSLTVRVDVGDSGAVPTLDPAHTLNRYWTLTEGANGIQANLLFHYLDGDVNGDETTYQLTRVEGTTAVRIPPPTATVNPALNQMAINNVTNFSKWLATEPLAPTNTPAMVSGHVVNSTGGPLAGVTMTLLDTVLVENRTTVTDVNGNYHFDAILTGRQIVVTPSKNGYTFNPQNRSFGHTGDITTVDFVGTESGQTRTIGSDFDGDGKADLSVFRPSDATWYTLLSSTGVFKAQQWGLGTDRIVPADYDGDHVTDVAVFRPSTGTWYINQSSTSTLRSVNWGLADDVVTPADFDGDGQADIAVFRPSTGTWYIIDSHNGQNRTIQWGMTGDRPVAADYDGDGKDDVAVWRPSNGIWYVLKSDGTYTNEHWGIEEDRQVVGDYDGDHKADMAVFRPSTATWYVKLSSDNSIETRGHGTAADILVPGDYDGDGKTDRAVWQTSGDWNILRSTTNTTYGQTWGMSGDIPTTSAYVR